MLEDKSRRDNDGLSLSWTISDIFRLILVRKQLFLVLSSGDRAMWASNFIEDFKQMHVHSHRSGHDPRRRNFLPALLRSDRSPRKNLASGGDNCHFTNDAPTILHEHENINSEDCENDSSPTILDIPGGLSGEGSGGTIRVEAVTTLGGTA